MATAAEFQAMAEADFDGLLMGEVAELVVYTPFEESAVPLQAVVRRQPQSIATYPDGSGVPSIAEVHLKRASLPVEPGYQDTLEFDGRPWGVREILPDPDTGIWRLLCVSYAAYEKGPEVLRYIR